MYIYADMRCILTSLRSQFCISNRRPRVDVPRFSTRFCGHRGDVRFNRAQINVLPFKLRRYSAAESLGRKRGLRFSFDRIFQPRRPGLWLHLPLIHFFICHVMKCSPLLTLGHYENGHAKPPLLSFHFRATSIVACAYRDVFARYQEK